MTKNETTGMTKEEEFDSFIIGSFLDLFHIMESRMEAEEERKKNDKGSSETAKDIQSEG